MLKILTSLRYDAAAGSKRPIRRNWRGHLRIHTSADRSESGCYAFKRISGEEGSMSLVCDCNPLDCTACRFAAGQ
jgi:hypothetical protein